MAGLHLTALLAFLAVGTVLVRHPGGEPTWSGSLESFVAQHPECRQVGDGCVICRVSSAKLVCSTPSIACTPGALVCLAPPPQAAPTTPDPR